MNKEQFVETLNDYLLAHGYARWESWDINYEWERYQRGRSWSNGFFLTLSDRLRERARIRRQIPGRKSVEEGKPDRIADLLDEAADALATKRTNGHGA